MSTAGKVLIVLVMLMIFVWIVLAAGVSRTNTNYNTKLNELTMKVEDLQTKVSDAQKEVASLLIQSELAQEKVDRESILLRARQSDLERARSQVSETLAAAKFELETADATVKAAQSDLEHRNTEHEEETKVLEKDRADVQELMAATDKQRKELGELRKDFQSKYHANVELLGKAASKAAAARSGSTH